MKMVNYCKINGVVTRIYETSLAYTVVQEFESGDISEVFSRTKLGSYEAWKRAEAYYDKKIKEVINGNLERL